MGKINVRSVIFSCVGVLIVLKCQQNSMIKVEVRKIMCFEYMTGRREKEVKAN